jgi:MoxR-like ATPase
VAATATAPVKTPLLDVVMDIKQALLDRTVNRTREIEAMLVATVAGEHCFMLSEPGAAKTMLVRLLFQCIDANEFSILMSKFTVLEDLYGPISATGLANDRWEHQTTGFLPWAQLALLDEAFKANGASLNADAVGAERAQMRNGDQVIPIPCCPARSCSPTSCPRTRRWPRSTTASPSACRSRRAWTTRPSTG